LAEAKTGKTKVLQEETRIFEPPKELVENSNVMKYMKKKGFKTEKELREWCSKNYIEFWDEMAKEYVDWFKPYSKVMDDSGMPYFKWFTGGEVNITYNCVDRHAKGAKKDKVAYIWVPEPTDQATQKITYGDLYKEVNKLANGLKSLGLKKGDRVSVYMPMIPQLPITVLACAKLGVIHSVVFSGFSSKGLSDRAADCGSRAIITTDGLYRRGKPVPLKPNVDEALAGAPSVEHVIVYKRTGIEVPWKDGRDVWWHDLVAGKSEECEPEKLDPEHRLYILYTSGHHRESRRGYRARPGRKRRRTGPDPPLGLRPEGERRLVVYRGYRMGHRPLLHRLRSSRPRYDGSHVRGRSRLPGLREMVEDHPGEQGISPLHRPHGDKDVHEAGC